MRHLFKKNFDQLLDGSYSAIIYKGEILLCLERQYAQNGRWFYRTVCPESRQVKIQCCIVFDQIVSCKDLVSHLVPSYERMHLSLEKDEMAERILLLMSERLSLLDDGWHEAMMPVFILREEFITRFGKRFGRAEAGDLFDLTWQTLLPARRNTYFVRTVIMQINALLEELQIVCKNFEVLDIILGKDVENGRSLEIGDSTVSLLHEHS